MSYPSTALPLHSDDLAHPKTCRNIELVSTQCKRFMLQYSFEGWKRLKLSPKHLLHQDPLGILFRTSVMLLENISKYIAVIIYGPHVGPNLNCSTNCEQLEVQPPSVHCGATPWCCIAPYHAFHSVFFWPQLEPLFGTLGTCLGPPLLKPFNLPYIKTYLHQCISMWMFPKIVVPPNHPF